MSPDGHFFKRTHYEWSVRVPLIVRVPGQDAAGSRRPEVAAVEADLRSRLLDGWDPAAVEQRVLSNQQERFFLREALSQGKRASWDFQPFFPAATQYVRK